MPGIKPQRVLNLNSSSSTHLKTLYLSVLYVFPDRQHCLYENMRNAHNGNQKEKGEVCKLGETAYRTRDPLHRPWGGV